jgi:alpha-L-fucosidase
VFTPVCQAQESTKPGLIGIQYDDEDFSEAEDLVNLTSLDQTWGQYSGFGRQWSGKWEGSIIGPATDEVKFTIESDQDARLEIAGKFNLSSKTGSAAGGMRMIRGRKYPIFVSFVKRGDGYDCHMKVQWSWTGQGPVTVDAESLVYSDEAEAELSKKAGIRTFEDSPDDGDVIKGDGPYIAKWSSLKKHNAAPDWFRDAKFGIYFHWGVYSVPAFGSEWYPSRMHVKDRPEYKHHVETYGDPSKFGYHDFVPMFKAEKFDADEWAELFKQAGARFAGPVAEHHDGFAMWASRLTPWNVKDMGPRRDITGEIAKAIRKRGMRLVTTFHHARNNQHQVERKGELVWTGYYPRVEGWATASEDPELRLLYGNIPREQFLELWKSKIIEVIDNYQPDIIWLESDLDMIPDKYVTEFLAHYFNKACEWGKEVVVTYKERGLPRDIGVEDFERGRENRLTEYAWLTDDTISLPESRTWGYTHDMKIRSTRYLLHVLIDIVSKNGQLLLNVSPKADGTIPDDQREVLLGVGGWLRKYGEAIYDTRPFVVFGEGPTRLKTGGEFAREQLQYKPEDIRFTTKGNIVYAIQLGWPGAKHETLLKSFSREQRQRSLKIRSVTMLGSDEKIAWSLRDDGLAVTSPLSPPDEMAVVYKIETSGIEHFRS